MRLIEESVLLGGDLMPSELIINTANFLQGFIPVLSLIGYLPQWRKLVRTKSSNDISLRSWAIWTVVSLIAAFYAVVQYQVTGVGVALVVSSMSILVFVFVTVYLVLKYRSDKPAN